MKHRPKAIAFAIISLSAMLLASCGKKEKKIPMSRQADAIRSIEAAQKSWRKAKRKRNASYMYRVDASQFVVGNPPAQILVAVKNNVVQCRSLSINGTVNWVEKGDDINNDKTFPLASTTEEALATCLDYARNEFTDNYEFEYALKSDKQLDFFGCYYTPVIKSRPPEIVIAPRQLTNFDPGICDF